MTITTKYDIGAKLWFLDYHLARVVEIKIIGISILDENTIEYVCQTTDNNYKGNRLDDGIFNFQEGWSNDRIFPTKEELFKSL